jgi:hypothetical protein
MQRGWRRIGANAAPQEYLVDRRLVKSKRGGGAAHRIADLAGEVPDEKGSFMSVVHESVGVGATCTGNQLKTLPAFVSS